MVNIFIHPDKIGNLFLANKDKLNNRAILIGSVVDDETGNPRLYITLEKHFGEPAIGIEAEDTTLIYRAQCRAQSLSESFKHIIRYERKYDSAINGHNKLDNISPELIDDRDSNILKATEDYIEVLLGKESDLDKDGMHDLCNKLYNEVSKLLYRSGHTIIKPVHIPSLNKNGVEEGIIVNLPYEKE